VPSSDIAPAPVLPRRHGLIGRRLSSSTSFTPENYQKRRSHRKIEKLVRATPCTGGSGLPNISFFIHATFALPIYWVRAAELGDQQSLYEAARSNARAAFFMKMGALVARACWKVRIQVMESK
jgi:hypothetical protein